MQVPALLITVRFGAEQNAGLKLVQIVTIPQNKSDDSALSSTGQINSKLTSSGVNPRLNFRINLRVAVADSGNRCGAYLCELRDVLQGGFQ